MKIYKRIISIVLVISLLSATTFIVRADSTLELSFTNSQTEIKPGETFEVNVYISNNPGIAGLTIGIGFDKDIITPISYTNKSSFTTLTNIDSKDIDLNSISEIKLTCDSMDNITDSGILGTIVFKAADIINTRETNINWVQDISSTVYDKNLTDINYKVKDLTLKIKDDMEYSTTTETSTETTTFAVETSTETTETTTMFLYGDVDNNGQVNKADLVRLAKYFAGAVSNIFDKAADVTHDGSVNRPDLVKLDKFFAGVISDLSK